MSELTPPPIPELEDTAEERSPSWVMLITMLLLIGVLFLSGLMLLYYAREKAQENADGEPVQMSDLIGNTLKLPTGIDSGVTSNEASAKDSDSGIKGLFRGDGSIRWPKLKLTGFGTATDAEGGFAIINGKQVLVGNSIGEVKLVEILNHGALVEYKGEQKILTVDHTR